MAHGPDIPLNGADAIARAVADCGIAACFVKSGDAFDVVGGARRTLALSRVQVLECLTDGAAAGAADGYARVAGTPALTSVSHGAGLAAAAGSLLNARRANSRILCVVNDLAVAHRHSTRARAVDLRELARPVVNHVVTIARAEEAGRRATEAVEACHGPVPGPVVLILPADVAASTHVVPGRSLFRSGPRPPWRGAIDAAARAIREAQRPVLILGASTVDETSLIAASRLQGAGVQVITPAVVSRIARGAGRFAPQRLPTTHAAAWAMLARADLVVLAGGDLPVADDPEPGAPGWIVPRDTKTISIGGGERDAAEALVWLAEACGARFLSSISPLWRPEAPAGRVTPETIGTSLTRVLREGSILIDDAPVASAAIHAATMGAAPHDWLGCAAEATGQGLPLAVGAATARPDSAVVCLVEQSSALASMNALWGMARGNLNIVVALLPDDGSPGGIDWTLVARGFGMSAETVDGAEMFEAALNRAVSASGPHMIVAPTG